MYVIFNKEKNDFIKNLGKTLIIENQHIAINTCNAIGDHCFVVPLKSLNDYKEELDHHIKELDEVIKKLYPSV